MKAVNIECDEKAIEAVNYLSRFCVDHPECKGCMFSFSQVCILKWTKPDGWDKSLSKVLERRKQNAKNKF